MLATVKSATSRYKSCQANGGTYFPFSDGAVIASFDERIKTDYSRCLTAMNSYVADYIDVCGDTKKDEYLVKALVEVIASDATIDANQLFYVCEDGSALTKAQICAASELCLQSFLLGIWHYIIVFVQDNKVGTDTYNEWCPARGGAPREYTAALGENSTRIIFFLCTFKFCLVQSNYHCTRNCNQNSRNQNQYPYTVVFTDGADNNVLFFHHFKPP